MKTETQPTRMIMINKSVFCMNELSLKETEKALQFRVVNTSCGSNELFWIPKSILKQVDGKWLLPAWYMSKFDHIK